MGVRSDVAVCLASEVYGVLPAEIHKWLKEDANSVSEVTEGVMFLFRDVKWYRDSDAGIIELYKWLKTQDEDHYLVMEACPEYPDNYDGDLGSWCDNPWNVHKQVSVSLEFEEVD